MGQGGNVEIPQAALLDTLRLEYRSGTKISETMVRSSYTQNYNASSPKYWPNLSREGWFVKIGTMRYRFDRLWFEHCV